VGAGVVLAARISAAILVLLVASAAQTPETSLSGELFDELGGPVIAARASLKATDGHLYLARTTERGAFRFPRIPQGTYTLDLEQTGFCLIHIERIDVGSGEQKKLPRITMASPNASGNCP
jgi:hypothetical protein